MSDHVEQAELEAFVLGDLDPSRANAFEEHVSACAACARRLGEEARFELALVEVRAASEGGVGAAPGRAVAARPSRHRLVYAAVATLALAAALALVLRGRVSPQPPVAATTARPFASAPAIAPAVCPKTIDQSACVERAHRHGLVVRYPGWVGPPPLGGSAKFDGPSSPPFLSEASRP